MPLNSVDIQQLYETICGRNKKGREGERRGEKVKRRGWTSNRSRRRSVEGERRFVRRLEKVREGWGK